MQVRLEVVSIGISNIGALVRAWPTSPNIGFKYLSLSIAGQRFRAEGILMPYLHKALSLAAIVTTVLTRQPQMKKLLPYVVDRLKESNVKYEIHSFDSGAIMVDIWIDKNFYVIQIDGETIGLSLITEETTPFDIIPDQTFKDEISFEKTFESIFLNIQSRKTVTINANNFSTLEGFYSEIDNVFTKDLDWTTGHNLNAFIDLLRGGFGVHEYEEPIKLIWQHSDKSKVDLNTLLQNETIYEILKSIIKEHNHIEFIES